MRMLECKLCYMENVAASQMCSDLSWVMTPPTPPPAPPHTHTHTHLGYLAHTHSAVPFQKAITLEV